MQAITGKLQWDTNDPLLLPNATHLKLEGQAKVKKNTILTYSAIENRLEGGVAE